MAQSSNPSSPLCRGKMAEDNYVKEEKIGEGTYGKVYTYFHSLCFCFHPAARSSFSPLDLLTVRGLPGALIALTWWSMCPLELQGMCL